MTSIKLPLRLILESRNISFGWDWSLRMNTMGFWKPVTLDWYSESGIKNHSVQTVNIENNQAELTLKMGLKRSVFGDLTWVSELFGNQNC